MERAIANSNDRAESPILFGYRSALGHWRVVGPSALRTARQRAAATKRARKMLALTLKPQVREGKRCPAGCGIPLDVVVASPAARTQAEGLSCHVWSALPDGCAVDAGENFFVSTPEFVFLQMATALAPVQLIALGYELCGTYCLGGESPASNRKAPLASVASLSRFLGKAPGARGAKRARWALRYVKDGSASPMETALTLMLCLPHRMGGYAVPWPQLNYRVDPPAKVQCLTDKSHYRCDLCWPEAKLAVEYDSKLHHADAAKQELDARRRNALLVLGYTVMTVSRGQLMDSGAFNRIARQVAKLLGKRLRYRDPDFTRAHISLRTEIWEALSSLR